MQIPSFKKSYIKNHKLKGPRFHLNNSTTSNESTHTDIRHKQDEQAERGKKKRMSGELQRAHLTSYDVHARRAQHHPLADAPAEMTDGQIIALHKLNLFLCLNFFFLIPHFLFLKRGVPVRGGRSCAVKNRWQKLPKEQDAAEVELKRVANGAGFKRCKL